MTMEVETTSRTIQISIKIWVTSSKIRIRTIITNSRMVEGLSKMSIKVWKDWCVHTARTHFTPLPYTILNLQTLTSLHFPVIIAFYRFLILSFTSREWLNFHFLYECCHHEVWYITTQNRNMCGNETENGNENE